MSYAFELPYPSPQESIVSRIAHTAINDRKSGLQTPYEVDKPVEHRGGRGELVVGGGDTDDLVDRAHALLHFVEPRHA